MVSASPYWLGPVLIASCYGPCHEFPSELAVYNHLGDDIVHVEVGPEPLADRIAAGEGSEFMEIPLGESRGSLVFRREDPAAEHEVSLGDLIGEVRESDCWVVLVDPCVDAPSEVCFTALQTDFQTDAGFECLPPQQSR